MGAETSRTVVQLALLGLFCGCARGPAGRGPDAGPWRDAEAEICARLLRVDAQRAAGRPLADDAGLVVSQWIAGYESRWFARVADGWQAVDALPEAPPWRVCVWPADPARAQRAFVLDSGGALLVRDGAANGPPP